MLYNSTNNELVRTKTLVKNAIVQIDATPYRQWYQQHYGVQLGKATAEDSAKVHPSLNPEAAPPAPPHVPCTGVTPKAVEPPGCRMTAHEHPTPPTTSPEPELLGGDLLPHETDHFTPYV